MKENYQSPEFHLLPGVPGMSNEELAALDEKTLERLLLENGYREHKKRYRISEGYILREIAGEALLAPVGGAPGNELTTLNETAAFLWKAFESPSTVMDVVCRAREAYDDPDGTLEAQVREFVTDNLKTGKLREA